MNKWMKSGLSAALAVAMLAGSGNAASDVGCFRSAGAWNYADEMCFTFGWGMSYTDFEQQITGVEYDAETDQYMVNVEVRNIGEKPGKCASGSLPSCKL